MAEVLKIATAGQGAMRLAGAAAQARAQRPVVPDLTGEGLYRDYKDPDVEDAYVAFAIEMEGGLSQDDQDINAIIENIRKGTGNGERS
jgi:hypothetical protein